MGNDLTGPTGPTGAQATSSTRRVVLASGSRYRAALLAGAGIAVEVDQPGIAERAADHRRTSPTIRQIGTRGTIPRRA